MTDRPQERAPADEGLREKIGKIVDDVLSDYEEGPVEFDAWKFSVTKRILAALAERPAHEGLRVPDVIHTLAECLRTQDNRSTAHPIFVVQQRIRDYGYDPEYTDDIAWLQSDEGLPVDDDKARRLEALCRGGRGVPEEYTRTGYRDRWEFVTACLTEAACEDYIEANRHRLTDPRVYAEIGYRNPEWQAVRGFLAGFHRPGPEPREPDAWLVESERDDRWEWEDCFRGNRRRAADSVLETYRDCGDEARIVPLYRDPPAPEQHSSGSHCSKCNHLESEHPVDIDGPGAGQQLLCTESAPSQPSQRGRHTYIGGKWSRACEKCGLPPEDPRHTRSPEPHPYVTTAGVIGCGVCQRLDDDPIHQGYAGSEPGDGGEDGWRPGESVAAYVRRRVQTETARLRALLTAAEQRAAMAENVGVYLEWEGRLGTLRRAMEDRDAMKHKRRAAEQRAEEAERLVNRDYNESEHQIKQLESRVRELEQERRRLRDAVGSDGPAGLDRLGVVSDILFGPATGEPERESAARAEGGSE